MDQLEIFSDERWSAFCCLCGGIPDTRDHIPSKVLLNQPYPEQLPVVPACYACNNSLSKDEEYFSCAIDCVINGDVKSPALRESTIKSFARSPRLRFALEKQCKEVDGNILWEVDRSRIARVLLKLARGHAFYEGGEVKTEAPRVLAFIPLQNMSNSELEAFEAGESHRLWPELGSRAFLRSVEGSLDFGPDGWINVQSGMYRYRVTAGPELKVEFVIREYLACTAIWE